jgi:tetrahedral aminopeptidase
MNELIKKLVEAYGPSGFEDGVRKLIQPEVESYADEVTVDALGNLIAFKKGTADSADRLKVMIAAHMDEIGLMVTHITKDGFLRFTNIGGVRRHTLLGSRVRFGNGTIGVIYSDRIENASQVHPLDKHYIDVGAGSPQDCPVSVGDAAVFIRPFLTQNGRLIAKSMDDRIGCAVAIETLRRLDSSPHNCYFVFSVQEEVGTRGAQTAANRISPDVGIALDVTTTGDIPESPPMAVSLGQGAAIKVKDSGMISHPGLVRLMRQRADEGNIRYQMEVLDGGTTDARPIQIANAGCAAGCISIPCRYVHSQSEMVDAADVESCVALLTAVLSNPISL